MKTVFDIKDINGRVIYAGLIQHPKYHHMLYWPTGGHITTDQCRFEKWTIHARAA